MNIDATKLLKYSYAAVDEEGKPLSSFEIGISSNSSASLKMVKKSGMDIEIPESLDNVIVSQSLNDSAAIMTSAVVIPIIQLSSFNVTNPDVIFKDGIRIFAAIFTKCCSDMCNKLCSSVTFKFSNGGVILVGKLQTGEVARYQTFGETPPMPKQNKTEEYNGVVYSIKEEDDNEVTIPMSKIKSLQKLNNIAGANGLIILYITKNGFLKITCNFSMFGDVVIYLKK
jgi:hypothetical protein